MNKQVDLNYGSNVVKMNKLTKMILYIKMKCINLKKTKIKNIKPDILY